MLPPKEELRVLRQLIKAIDDEVVMMTEKGMTPERVAALRAEVANLEKRLADWERGGGNANRT
jgi:hypothetical protein